MLTKLLQSFGKKENKKTNDLESQNDQNHVDTSLSSSLASEQEAQSSLYDFNVMTLDDMKAHPDAINDMYIGKTDGFLIKNIMSSADVDKLLFELEKIKEKDTGLAHTPVGFTYPPIFAEYSRRIDGLTEAEKEEEIRKYFERSKEFNDGFAAHFGVDAYKLITDFFTTLGGGRKVGVPEGVKVGQYPFATFRYLIPEQGLMSVHCGNYFGKTFEKTYSHLTTLVAVENQMSYFIMLHEPEAGGELSLFNFRWKDGQTKTNPGEDNEIIQPDGTKCYVQTDPTIRKNKLRPEKGDMILFQGGNIWHRVEKVRGTKPRITLGGFLSLNHKGDTIYYWS